MTLELDTTAFKFLNKSYNEALALTQKSKDYFNHNGRTDKLKLSLEDNLVYTMAMSTITIQLTSVLSWLLLCKAIENGEISLNEIHENSLKLQNTNTIIECDDPRYGILPNEIQQMLKQSHNLYERVKRMESSILNTALEHTVH